MKSRVFTLISLLALAATLSVAPAAMAQTSPAQDVYNPNGEVLDVVEGGGSDEALCDEADGLDADGNPTETGSAADCAETAAETICAEADGLDANGNATERGSAADCAEAAAAVCAEADGTDAAGNPATYGSAADCATATPTVSEGQLPFTGFEAGIVALAGLALLGGGFAMRRLSRQS